MWSHLKDAPTACRQLVSDSISLPLQGFFSPFPHGTCSLSVAEEYLALEDGPPRFPQGYTCLAVLRYRLCLFQVQIRGYHSLWRNFPVLFSCLLQNHVCRPYNPNQSKLFGLGSSRFARHYYGSLF
ncbi:Unknown [Lawsonia intracellularis PHE/MN1-00]|uniref:Uncharacterized protein n=1 Tax=Lawsonia intracellularis (strain PHE/MN1-00) TaxID=363253 RepID=Q1MP77_LAWIP|nr:Unknown [Lawsonia intracellularis PHE/MN1-00]